MSTIFFCGDQKCICKEKKSLLFTYLKESTRILILEYFCLTSLEAVCNIPNLERKILTAILIVVEDKGHEVSLDRCVACVGSEPEAAALWGAGHRIGLYSESMASFH